jgi:hypothetical protein
MDDLVYTALTKVVNMTSEYSMSRDQRPKHVAHIWKEVDESLDQEIKRQLKDEFK